jgi:transposase
VLPNSRFTPYYFLITIGSGFSGDLMIGKKKQSEPKLFYHGISLDRRIRPDHPLRKIRNSIDFDFARDRVMPLYGSTGNPSIDPAVILKLIFLLFYENVKSERALMEQLPLRLDWLWFCGYDLDEEIPDHSVLSKARRRWGKAVFAEFFQTILQQCIQAGLVDGQTIHIDSSMINANASKDKLQVQLRVVGNDLYQQLEQQTEPETLEKRVNPVDPDARLGCKYGKTTLGYKDHRTVDDQHGIITSTITTPANINDQKRLSQAIESHQANTGVDVQIAVADKDYGIGENYQYLQEHGITPCISHQRYKGIAADSFASDKFEYDKSADCYHCPGGHELTRKETKLKENAIVYRIDRRICEQCVHFKACVASTQLGRRVQRSTYAEYYEWADSCLSKYRRKRLMAHRKAKIEGSFADAANNHGFKRARWRGLAMVQIQNHMIAAIQNLRKLIRAVVGKTPVNVAAGPVWQDIMAILTQIRRRVIPIT